MGQGPASTWPWVHVEVHLNQHVEHPLDPLGRCIQGHDKFQAVHGFHHVRPGEDRARLIGLQLTDHVPSKRRSVTNLGSLSPGLLVAIFADIPATEFCKQSHIGCRECLGYHDEVNVTGRTTSKGSRFRNALTRGC